MRQCLTAAVVLHQPPLEWEEAHVVAAAESSDSVEFQYSIEIDQREQNLGHCSHFQFELDEETLATTYDLIDAHAECTHLAAYDHVLLIVIGVAVMIDLRELATKVEVL